MVYKKLYMNSWNIYLTHAVFMNGWRKGYFTLPRFVENFSTFSRLFDIFKTFYVFFDTIIVSVEKYVEKVEKMLTNLRQTKVKLISQEKSYLPNSWKHLRVLDNIVAYLVTFQSQKFKFSNSKLIFFLTGKTGKIKLPWEFFSYSPAF